MGKNLNTLANDLMRTEKVPFNQRGYLFPQYLKKVRRILAEGVIAKIRRFSDDVKKVVLSEEERDVAHHVVFRAVCLMKDVLDWVSERDGVWVTEQGHISAFSGSNRGIKFFVAKDLNLQERMAECSPVVRGLFNEDGLFFDENIKKEILKKSSGEIEVLFCGFHDSNCFLSDTLEHFGIKTPKWEYVPAN
ncbi:hypothetical protein K8R66_03570 [bacterium]|nr:hypothetical protein [bacterium]